MRHNYIFNTDYPFNDYFNNCHNRCFWRKRRGDRRFSTKRQRGLKKWSDRLADALKRLAGKVTEELPAIAGSIFGAILSLLGKTVGVVAEDTWALIVFVAGLVGWWLMQKVKKE